MWLVGNKLLLLLLLKQAAQAQVRKTKLVINCLRNSTSTCATAEKLKKQTRGSHQRLIAPLNLSNVPVSGQETPCKLGRSTP